MDGRKCPDGYELYEPVVGEVYSPGTMCRLKNDEHDEWMEQNCDRSHCDAEWADVDRQFIYMRPVSSNAHTKPLDIDLPYLLKKSAACSPEIQSQVLALKAKFAEMVGKLIEADRSKRLSLSQAVDQKADSGTKGASE